jgi:hypothetical protein
MHVLRDSRLRPAALWALAALAGLAALLAARAEPAGAASQPPLRTGVSYVYGNDLVEFQHVAAAGATRVMTPLKWRSVAPKAQPGAWDPANPADSHYDWEFFDLWVGRAVEAGLTPILQVRGAPDWAQRCSPPAPDSPCNIDPVALEAFARAAASRYSGSFQGLPRVRYWQGLNEPNLIYYFRPQFQGGKIVSPIVYRRLINRFYAAIKSVNPSNFVIAAGLSPLAQQGFSVGPMNFTRRLLCMTGRQDPKPLPGKCEGGVHFDIFDVHPYTSGGPTHEGGIDDVELGDIPELVELLRAADQAGRIKGNQFKRTPLWILEMSWDSNPPDPTGLPMKIEMQWISEALYRTWKAGVHDFFWFSLVDFNPNPPSEDEEVLQSGLYFFAPNPADMQPKPLVTSFRFPFVAFPKEGKGMLVWGRTPTSSRGRIAVEARRGGDWRRIGVLRAGANGIFTAMLKSGYGGNKKGAVRATYLDQASVPFPMNPVGDFFQPPFGYE